GTGFVSASAVNWNGSPRSTTFVSATQVTAAIPASDLDHSGPTTAGVTVVNPLSNGGPSNAVSFAITSSLQIVTASPLPAGTINSSYSTTVQATGGVGALTWSLASGSLPAGLSLNTSTGVISGTPTQAGSFAFTVQVQDTTSQKPTKAFSLDVHSLVPAIT